MSIAIDKFAAQDLFPTFDPHRRQTTHGAMVFGLQCRRCGYEVDDVAQAPHTVCPKCHGDSWERFVRPGSLLQVMDEDAQCVAGADLR